MRVFFGVAVLIASLCSASVGAQELRAVPPAAEIIATFDELIAFEEANGRPFVRKWTREIRVAVEDADAQQLEEVGHAFHQIENLIPQRIRFSSNDANFVIVFMKSIAGEIGKHRDLLRHTIAGEESLQKFIAQAEARNDSYLFSRGLRLEGDIAVFCLFIKTDRSDSVETFPPKHFLVKGILTGLGIGQGNVDTNSIFNPALNLSSLTPIDREVVRAFYSSSIGAGTPLRGVRNQFVQALKK